MTRTVFALMFAGLCGIPLWCGQAQADTSEPLAERSVQMASSQSTPNVLPAQTRSAAPPPIEDSAWSMFSRSWFLLGALVLMTVVLIITHHREQPETASKETTST